MPHVHEGQTEILVKIGSAEGVTAIPSPSPLTRLNYYDGKFLRAADLKLEQEHLRRLNALSNQAGGAGVVHGFDCVLLGGDQIGIGPGLAIDPAGRVLLLPQEKGFALGELIEASRRRERKATPARKGADLFRECDSSVTEEPAEGLDGAVLYVITIGHAEAYCGEEDVYGRLCEEACVTATDRPYILEGVVVRATPLNLTLENWPSVSRLHLRSRAASAYFEEERKRIASLISRDGLASEAWCLGALPLGGTDVPIALVARAGATTVFLDAWTVRRERMDAPPRQYWAWRMAMRPWSAFLAQVLQFQCQLRDSFGDRPDQGGDVDPCGDSKALLHEAAKTLDEMMTFYGKVSARIAKLDLESGGASGLTQLKDLQRRLVRAGQAVYQGADRILIRRGFVELPSAGYLPVLPSSALTVNQQVRRLMGPGVDLRFCVVRPDYVPHALEEAQHMERISLLRGLDNPQDKPEVDILVPGGKILDRDVRAEGLWFRGAKAGFSGLRFGNFYKALYKKISESTETVVVNGGEDETEFTVRGVAHSEALASGGGAFYFAGVTPLVEESGERGFEIQFGDHAATWMALRCEANPFTAERGASVPVSLRIVRSHSVDGEIVPVEVQASATFQIDSIETGDGSAHLAGRLSGFLFFRRGTKTVSRKSELGVTVDFYPEGTGRVVSIAVNEFPKIRLRVRWEGGPLTVAATLDQERQDVVGQLTEDAAVQGAADPDHTLALKVLKVLGVSLDDSRFAEDAARLLFPAPKPAPEELEVRAVRDWVLFRRRRSCTCATEAVKPELSPGRKYEVLHLKGSEQSLLTAWKALQAGSVEVSRFPFEPVTAVDFAGGSSVLVSDSGDVLADWKDVDHGSRVLFASIASQGAAEADGNDLAEDRLTRLTGVLAATTPLDPNASLEVLPKFPESLAAPGTDGVIVLLTIEEATVVDTRHKVYRVDTTLVSSLKSSLKTGIPEEVLKNIQAVELGEVVFEGLTDVLKDKGGVPAAWQQSVSLIATEFLVVFQTGEAKGGSPAVRMAQSKSILASIGAPSGLTGTQVNSSKALAGDYLTLTIIVTNLKPPA